MSVCSLLLQSHSDERVMLARRRSSNKHISTCVLTSILLRKCMRTPTAFAAAAAATIAATAAAAAEP
jgi:hypothetical protein